MVQRKRGIAAKERRELKEFFLRSLRSFAAINFHSLCSLWLIIILF
jgi:hypothetical protein